MLRLPAWRPETHLKPRHLALPALLLLTTAAFAQDKLPIWAYPAHFTAGSGAPSTEPQHLPGSKATYTKAEIGNIWVVPDWYQTPTRPCRKLCPTVVSRMSIPAGIAICPTGKVAPENASVAGLSAAYIIQQMADFKSGARKGSDPEMLSVTNMEKLAKSATDEDVQAAAAYFSSIKLKPWIRVVEVEEVPKTKPAGGMMVVMDGGGNEPIGDRVIEVSENLEKTELRDPTSGFIAYVPRAVSTGEKPW